MVAILTPNAVEVAAKRQWYWTDSTAITNSEVNPESKDSTRYYCPFCKLEEESYVIQNKTLS